MTYPFLMITISHQQARRLLQENLDRKIPENQWVALQAHLETCVDCRDYLAQLKGLERDLRRVLNARLEWVQDGNPLYSGRLLAQLRKLIRFRQQVWSGVAFLVAILAFWLLGGAQWFSGKVADLRGIPEPRSAEKITYQESERSDLFHEQVLISAEVKDRTDLYLIYPDGMVENLTGGIGAPMSNTDPAWSPDGQWIAYLSINGDKNEVMILSPGATKPMQITNEPGIQWNGPLSWSPDGRWIALTGVRRDQGNQSWVYLVSLDGMESPRALAGTRGGWSPEFSPTGEQVAYLTGSLGNGSVSVFTFGKGEEFATVSKSLHWTGSQAMGVRVAPGVIRFDNSRLDGADGDITDSSALPAFRYGAGLDWSPDGKSLVYIGESSQGGGSALVIQREMDYSVSLYADYQVYSHLAQSISTAAYGAVAWAPRGGVVFLEDPNVMLPVLTPGSTEICWGLKTHPTSYHEKQHLPVRLGGLCVTSRLDRSNWSADGRWLVLSARNASESRHFLYAVRMPDERTHESPVAGTVVRLSNAAELFGSETLPRVRPQGLFLNIHPHAVRGNEDTLSLPDVSNKPGSIVYSQRNNDGTVIVRSNPDGTGGDILTGSTGRNHCPRFSPDGRQIVFISDHPSSTFVSGSGHLGVGGGGYPQQEALLLMSQESGELEQISTFSWLAKGNPGSMAPVFTGCPLWSPDGNYLAVPVSTAHGDYAAIFPHPDLREKGAQEHFIQLEDRASDIAWTADSHGLLLVQSDNERTVLLFVRLPENMIGEISISKYQPQTPSGSVIDIVVSPDSRELFLFTTIAIPNQPSAVILHQYSLADWVKVREQALGITKPGSIFGGPFAFSWVSGGDLGFILHGQAEDKYKASIWRYNPSTGGLKILAQFDDVIQAVAWNADGNWLMFSSESGLWLLDVKDSTIGRPAPIWISPLSVNDLDWFMTENLVFR